MSSNSHMKPLGLAILISLLVTIVTIVASDGPTSREIKSWVRADLAKSANVPWGFGG